MRQGITFQVQKSQQKFLNNKVKSHWSVENKLHWSLDVTFREDADKKWFKNSANNFLLLRQMVLNLLRKEPFVAPVKNIPKLLSYCLFKGLEISLKL